MIPYFSWEYQGLSLIVKDRSYGSYTQCHWDFGDGSTQTSNPLESVTHSYANAGMYDVSLYLTDTSNPATDPVKFRVYMVEDETNPGISITELVMSNLPISLNTNSGFIALCIRKWQIYLANLFNPIVDNPLNEASWSFTQKELISKLTAYDLIILELNSVMASVTSLETDLASGQSSISSKGPLKRIETGPSSAEWYDASALIIGIINSGNKTGFIQAITNDVCMFARRLGVRLPMCPNPPLRGQFIIAKKYR